MFHVPIAPNIYGTSPFSLALCSLISSCSLSIDSPQHGEAKQSTVIDESVVSNVERADPIRFTYWLVIE